MTANRLSPGQDRARLAPRQKVAKTRASRRFSSPVITGDNCIRGQIVGNMWACPHLTQERTSARGFTVRAGRPENTAEHVSPEHVASTMIYRAITPIGPLTPVATAD